jgi:hypothetical protein
MVFGKKEGPPQNHASKFHANKAWKFAVVFFYTNFKRF